MKVRVLVTGDRNWTDKEAIRLELKHIPGYNAVGIAICQGDAAGADRLAAAVAFEEGWECTSFPAKWDEYGRAAGVIRNQVMLDLFKPQYVIAFHDNLEKSKGTADMVQKARKSRIPVRHVKHTLYGRWL